MESGPIQLDHMQLVGVRYRTRTPNHNHTTIMTQENSETVPNKKGNKMGVGIGLGIAIGASIGVATGNLAVWIGLGVAFGVVLGVVLNKS